MGKTVNENSKDFLVSTADVAFYVNDILAFTGTTSLNTSISVSMEDQEVTGGKGNKTLYKYKYGRKLNSSIEMAEWKLEFIASQVGQTIFEGAKDVFAVAECVTLTNGVGVLAKTPVGKVFVEKGDGSIVQVEANENTITVGTDNGKVHATYQYNTTVKRITIDAESTPFVGRLVLSADKHNNKKGKVGELQIEIPSFQLSGTFDISLEASGTSSTKLDGDALAVEGDTCADGSVYAYVTEIPSEAASIAVADIAATPAYMTLGTNEEKTISVIGIKGGMYSNVAIDASECTMTSDNSGTATVTNGTVKGVSSGTTYINIEYNGIKDVVKVVVS